MSSQEQTLPQTFESNKQRLQNAQEILNLPESLVDTSVMIYKQAYMNDLYHGRPLEDILSACLHLACKVEQKPCNPSQIADEFDTTRQKVLKTSRHFESKLGLEAAPVDPKGFIDQFSDALSLSDTTRLTAHDIFDAFSEYESGKSPTGLAAGAIYAATKQTDERVTQKKISEVADVSEVTIRTIYKQQQQEYSRKNQQFSSPEPSQAPTPN